MGARELRKNSEGRIKALAKALEWGRVKVAPAEDFTEAHSR